MLSLCGSIFTALPNIYKVNRSPIIPFIICYYSVNLGNEINLNYRHYGYLVYLNVLLFKFLSHQNFSKRPVHMVILVMKYKQLHTDEFENNYQYIVGMQQLYIMMIQQ